MCSTTLREPKLDQQHRLILARLALSWFGSPLHLELLQTFSIWRAGEASIEADAAGQFSGEVNAQACYNHKDA